MYSIYVYILYIKTNTYYQPILVDNDSSLIYWLAVGLPLYQTLTLHIHIDGAVFPCVVVNTHIATHVVCLCHRHLDISHPALFHFSLQSATPLSLPPQPGRGVGHRGIVVATQLQSPPLRNNYVRPARGDDWLGPGWNSGHTQSMLTCRFRLGSDCRFYSGSDQISRFVKIMVLNSNTAVWWPWILRWRMASQEGKSLLIIPYVIKLLSHKGRIERNINQLKEQENRIE